MGKGVALQFKQLFPDMFKEYRRHCEQGRFSIGNLSLHKTENKWVLNFPTKKHWRQPSRPEYIEAGLKRLVSIYEETGLYDIAMPLLGCGNGELDWPTQVEPIVERYLKALPINVFIHFYPRGVAPVPEHRNIADMEEWLRSEPEQLAFAEVWRDLQHLIANSHTFETLAAQTRFTASVSDDPVGVRVVTNSKQVLFTYDELLDFWQQLRSYGYTFRSIAPSGLTRDASYLYPLFSRLSYVTPIEMSASYSRLRRGNDSIGLQYRPRPRVAELPLFRDSVAL